MKHLGNPLEYYTESYEKDKFIVIHREQISFILAGYPHWESFSYLHATGTRMSYSIEIDLLSRTLKKLPEIYITTSKALPQKELQDIKEKIEDYEQQLIDKFFNTIPSEIVRLVRDFPDSHWSLIEAIIHVGPYFTRLIKSNQALAYLLVNIREFNPAFLIYDDISTTQELITRKQKEILRIANFPNSESSVKSFSKIRIQDLSIKLLHSLCKVMKSPDLHETISHFQEINKNHFDLISENKNLIKLMSENFVKELTDSEEYDSLIKEISSIAKLVKRWELPEPRLLVLEDLNKIKTKVEKAAIRKQELLERLPDPPLPDNEYIKALKTVVEIGSWARNQSNCIRTFIPDVKAGKRFFYKVVFKEEEATLELLTKKKGLEFGDLLGNKNMKVSTELFEMVKEWYKNNKKIYLAGKGGQ